MKEITFRQIILITDGCYNVGFDPEAAASIIRQRNIQVNVIGVVNRKPIGRQGEDEVERIAAAGGGVSQIVHTDRLARTMQTVTRQAMTQTMQQVVQRELQDVLGGDGLQRLAPEKRGEIVDRMEQWGETGALHVALLIDTSASMRSKMAAVREAIADFGTSLISRAGQSEMTCLTFPGKNRVVQRKMDWTERVSDVRRIGGRLEMAGTTPTGSALLETMHCFGVSPHEAPLHKEKVTGDFGEYVF